MDVFAGEPDINPAFAALDNVLLTPHTGSNTLHARNEMARAASRRILDRLEDVYKRQGIGGEAAGEHELVIVPGRAQVGGHLQHLSGGAGVGAAVGE